MWRSGRVLPLVSRHLTTRRFERGRNGEPHKERKRTGVIQAQPDIVLFGNLKIGGGKGRCVANLIPVWDRLGIKVQILGYRDAQLFHPEEFPDSLGFLHLGTRERLPTLFRLWRYLRKVQPKAVLARHHADNVLIAAAGRLPGVHSRIVVEARNNYVASVRGGKGKQRKKMAQIRRFYPWADALIGASQGVARDLREAAKLWELPGYSIPNTTITPSLFEQGQEAVDHPWLQEGATPVVLSVARFAPQKDLPTLLKAVAKARQSRPLRLIMLGKGPEKEAIQQEVRRLGLEEVVAMPGHVSNPYAWMARADLLALSSAWEGSPNVLIEALALGTPVVSTDCPSGPAEILENGRYGRLVPVGDSSALAEAICRSLDHPLDFDRDEATRPYTVEHAAPRYLDVLLPGKERPA
ncbi:glycosyltransferase [Thiohalorhabdus sp. Cl-TMA]|uniref:Glycosyltransferase n=1 Tax=Thiohalorhabdus methylotrophus TaxID=3242694 RepID=A0ABV4TVF3_9GAMM